VERKDELSENSCHVREELEGWVVKVKDGKWKWNSHRLGVDTERSMVDEREQLGQEQKNLEVSVGCFVSHCCCPWEY
jgi:hypothetical protein